MRMQVAHCKSRSFFKRLGPALHFGKDTVKYIIITVGVFILIVLAWFFVPSRPIEESSFVCKKSETPQVDMNAASSPIPLENIIKGTFRDFSGNAVNILDFVGTPLVINSWAVWCPFCRKELPDFAQVQQDLDSEVRIIAIDRQEPLQTVKTYIDELGVNNDLLFLLDENDSFYRSIGGFSMPETLFVNKEGNIVFHKRGPMDAEEICRRTQALL